MFKFFHSRFLLQVFPAPLTLRLKGETLSPCETLSPAAGLTPCPPCFVIFAAFFAWFSLLKREKPCYFRCCFCARLPLGFATVRPLPCGFPSFDRTPPLNFFISLATMPHFGTRLRSACLCIKKPLGDASS